MGGDFVHLFLFCPLAPISDNIDLVGLGFCFFGYPVEIDCFCGAAAFVSVAADDAELELIHYY